MLRNPSRARAWCGPSVFEFNIVNVSASTATPRSSPLRVSFVWGRCNSDTFVGWYSSGKSGTPSQSNPPTPVGDCPNGAFARSFDVCERCGTSGLSTPKTLWGCTLTEARTNMGLPGCVYTVRSGINCP